MISPRSTSTRTVARKVMIQSKPSQTDRDQCCSTSNIFLNIPVSEERMMEARTQTGRGSNTGARLRMRAVIRVSQPDFSCTRDLDSEEDMGTQL